MPRGTSRYDEALLQGRLWTPTARANLAFWYSADGPLAVPFSTSVGDWLDRGPSANKASSTASHQPDYISNGGPNGAPAVTFSRTREDWLTPATLVGYSGAAGYSGFAIAERSTSATSRAIFGYSGSGAVEWRYDAGHTLTLLRNNQAGLATSAAAAPAQTNIVGFSARTNFSLVSVNGTETITATNPAFSAAFDQIGTSSGTEAMDGDICEVFLYATCLDFYDRSRAEGYLAWKWGLVANLALDHPYKNRPPLR